MLIDLTSTVRSGRMKRCRSFRVPWAGYSGEVGQEKPLYYMSIMTKTGNSVGLHFKHEMTDSMMQFYIGWDGTMTS
jgi:hypothetical protein